MHPDMMLFNIWGHPLSHWALVQIQPELFSWKRGGGSWAVWSFIHFRGTGVPKGSPPPQKGWKWSGGGGFLTFIGIGDMDATVGDWFCGLIMWLGFCKLFLTKTVVKDTRKRYPIIWQTEGAGVEGRVVKDKIWQMRRWWDEGGEDTGPAAGLHCPGMLGTPGTTQAIQIFCCQIYEFVASVFIFYGILCSTYFSLKMILEAQTLLPIA